MPGFQPELIAVENSGKSPDYLYTTLLPLIKLLSLKTSHLLS